jgi:photosystem II stability/assembly factor-like uncharacterized protein
MPLERTQMSELESEISAQLHRRAEALPVSGGLPEHILAQVHRRQRRRRLTVAGAPVVLLAVVAALVGALVVPSHVRAPNLQVSAAPSIHGLPGATNPLPPSADRLPPSADAPFLLEPVVLDNLRWLDFVSSKEGWALAEVGNILRVAHTTDSGQSWTTAGSPPPIMPGSPTPNRLVVAIGGNESTGDVATLYAFAVGDVLGSGKGSDLDVSSDGGSSWQVVSFPGPVLSVAPPPAPRPSASKLDVWALIGSSPKSTHSQGAKLAFSSDAGRTWQVGATIPGEGGTHGFLVRAGQRSGFVISGTNAGEQPRSLLIATNNSGSSWHQLSDPCGRLPDQHLDAVSANDLWLACGSETSTDLQGKSVYRSSDQGKSWQLATSVGLTRGVSNSSLNEVGNVVGLSAVSISNAWIALRGSQVEMTTNAGRSWRPAFPSSAGTDDPEQVVFVDPTHGWVLTTGGVWHTADAVNWEKFDG